MIVGEVHLENELSKQCPVVDFSYTFSFQSLTKQENSLISYGHRKIPAFCR